MTTSDGAETSVAKAAAKVAKGDGPTVSDQTKRTKRTKPAWLARWVASTAADSRSRRVLLGAMVYLVCTVTFAIVAGRDRLAEHTAFNHYALLADAWLHGRQDLPHGPPPYAQNNDFVDYNGKTFISFPPFPAALMLPFVKLAGSAENFRDGQFVIWLGGIAPAVLFLALEKLRRTSRAPRSELENLALSFLFSFGTVYFFTAVEGTVWFAALVVAAALEALFVLCALDAEQPLLAGVMMGCAYLTRPPVCLATPLFIFEAIRVSARGGLPVEGPWTARVRETFRRLDARALARRFILFGAPIALALALVAWMNFARYGRPTPIYFDHELLTVAWRGRMQKWGGMLSYHFLAKNLGIALTSLPWLPAKGEGGIFGAPFKINEHGLALWFTTPIYLWVLWPRRLDERDRKWLYVVVAMSAALSATMDLLYQNSGWRQFGYRFSNDYAVLLFVLLAIGAQPMRHLFKAAAAWSVACNLFGAVTFDRAVFDRFYFRDGSQTIVYQPD
jgi:hypothetical protein